MLLESLFAMIDDNENINEENKQKIKNYLNIIDYKFPNLSIIKSTFLFTTLNISNNINNNLIKYNKENNTLYINDNINYNLNNEYIYLNQLIHILCTNINKKVGIEDNGLKNLNEGIIELLTNQIIPNDVNKLQFFDELVIADIFNTVLDNNIFNYLFENETIPFLKSTIKDINNMEKSNELFNLIYRNRPTNRIKKNESNLSNILFTYLNLILKSNNISKEKADEIRSKLYYYNNQIQFMKNSTMYSSLDKCINEINSNSIKVLKKNK